jgi:hypothetical protein
MSRSGPSKGALASVGGVELPASSATVVVGGVLESTWD